MQQLIMTSTNYFLYAFCVIGGLFMVVCMWSALLTLFFTKNKKKITHKNKGKKVENSFAREIREEREAKQNAQFTPWERWSAWGKFKHFVVGYIIVFGFLFFIPTFLSYKYLIFGGIIAKIISLPFAIFYTYAYCFFINAERNNIRELKGKDRIEFKDKLEDLPRRSLVKKI